MLPLNLRSVGGFMGWPTTCNSTSSGTKVFAIATYLSSAVASSSTTSISTQWVAYKLIATLFVMFDLPIVLTRDLFTLVLCSFWSLSNGKSNCYFTSLILSHHVILMVLFLLNHVENFIKGRQLIRSEYLTSDCGKSLIIEFHQKLVHLFSLYHLDHLLSNSMHVSWNFGIII